MNRPTNSAVASFGALIVALAPVANAHHSVAAYDRDHPVTRSGTIREFKFMNPHTWIVLMVPDGNGSDGMWNLEGAALSAMVRKGWARDTLRPGMQVRLMIAPRKDGAIGGEWLRVLEIDGQSVESNPKFGTQ
jgi:hypothetical protein